MPRRLWLSLPIVALTACSPNAPPSDPLSPIAPAPTGPTPTSSLPPAPVTITFAPASDPALTVDDFHVIEFKYLDTGNWEYAPQARLSVPAAPSPITITDLEIAIPGLGRSPGCRMSGAVAAGVSADLFGTGYGGDYDFVIDSPGHRATAGASAQIRLAFTVANDPLSHQVVASGPVMPGVFSPHTVQGIFGGCRVP